MSSDQPPSEPVEPVAPAEPAAPGEPAGATGSARATGPAASTVRPDRQRPPDANPWNWLLLLPIVIPLLTLLYNHDGPHFLGFPAFYWLQLLFVFLGVGSTTVVYQMTKRRD
jgi:Protein of unknown function (DUF3311)